MADTNGKSWQEYLRLITPAGIFILGIFISSIKSDIDRIELAIREVDSKVFMHLTNDEIHTPRGMVVSQDAFLVYQNMRDRQMEELKERLVDIKTTILKTK